MWSLNVKFIKIGKEEESDLLLLLLKLLLIFETVSVHFDTKLGKLTRPCTVKQQYSTDGNIVCFIEERFVLSTYVITIFSALIWIKLLLLCMNLINYRCEDGKLTCTTRVKLRADSHQSGYLIQSCLL